MKRMIMCLLHNFIQNKKNVQRMRKVQPHKELHEIILEVEKN